MRLYKRAQHEPYCFITFTPQKHIKASLSSPFFFFYDILFITITMFESVYTYLSLFYKALAIFHQFSSEKLVHRNIFQIFFFD